jgi:hypothetical protein
LAIFPHNLNCVTSTVESASKWNSNWTVTVLCYGMWIVLWYVNYNSHCIVLWYVNYNSHCIVLWYVNYNSHCIVLWYVNYNQLAECPFLWCQYINCT